MGPKLATYELNYMPYLTVFSSKYGYYIRSKLARNFQTHLYDSLYVIGLRVYILALIELFLLADKNLDLNNLESMYELKVVVVCMLSCCDLILMIGG